MSERNEVTTTGAVPAFTRIAFGKLSRKIRPRSLRKKKKKKKKRGAPLSLAFTALVASAVDEWHDGLFEKVGHSRTGGKAMLGAWFGKKLLRRKLKSGDYIGYKGHRYKVTKLGGGKYRITRVK